LTLFEVAWRNGTICQLPILAKNSSLITIVSDILNLSKFSTSPFLFTTPFAAILVAVHVAIRYVHPLLALVCNPGIGPRFVEDLDVVKLMIHCYFSWLTRLFSILWEVTATK
jgi:ABC-type transport system involved in cytochrome c biogenesis permease component